MGSTYQRDGRERLCQTVAGVIATRAIRARCVPVVLLAYKRQRRHKWGYCENEGQERGSEHRGRVARDRVCVLRGTLTGAQQLYL